MAETKENRMNTTKFEKKQTRVVAHRGLSGIEKENTASAFVAAGNRSYFGIETDIHRTADGRFIVCHDASLLRVAGENLNVEEVSLALSQSATLFDTDGTKGRADLITPTLENYLCICKKYEKHCVLELKSDFTDEEKDQTVEDRFCNLATEDISELKLTGNHPKGTEIKVTFSISEEGILSVNATRDSDVIDFQLKVAGVKSEEELRKSQNFIANATVE